MARAVQPEKVWIEHKAGNPPVQVTKEAYESVYADLGWKTVSKSAVKQLEEGEIANG